MIGDNRTTNKPLIFLLPFAGGNEYSYSFLTPHLTEFEVKPLSLPGRGKRTKESLIGDVNLAVEDYRRQIQENLDRKNFLIYGHSLGSLFGLLVTSELEKMGRKPTCLILTGSPGPGVVRPSPKHLLPREDFIRMLKSIGGLPDEFFNDNDLFTFFEPILRKDFELYHRGQIMPSWPVLKTPICAIMGTEEEYASEVNNWNKYTSSELFVELWSGKHFFILDWTKRLALKIKSMHDKCLVL